MLLKGTVTFMKKYLKQCYIFCINQIDELTHFLSMSSPSPIFCFTCWHNYFTASVVMEITQKLIKTLIHQTQSIVEPFGTWLIRSHKYKLSYSKKLLSLCLSLSVVFLEAYEAQWSGSWLFYCQFTKINCQICRFDRDISH